MTMVNMGWLTELTTTTLCKVAFLGVYQIKSNQIYLPAQNVKEKQLKNIRLTQRLNQRLTDCEC